MIRPNPDLCPSSVSDSIQEYLHLGIPPGGFVTAVLENNLVGAFCAADSINLFLMPHIAAYLYNNVPTAAWGSRKIVNAWIEKKAEERRNQCSKS